MLKIGNGADGSATNFIKFSFDDENEQLIRLFKLVLADIGQRVVDARVPGMTTEGGTFGNKNKTKYNTKKVIFAHYQYF